jgi:hypothetical protein
MKWTLMLAGVLGVAGCSQEVPDVPAPVAAPVPAASAPAEAVAPALPSENVTVELSGVECGETPVAIATVAWDAGALAAGGVSIFVESPGNARKLWAEAGQKDRATTGKWVFQGTRFTLQDRVSGALLAQRSVDTIPCPAQ